MLAAGAAILMMMVWAVAGWRRLRGTSVAAIHQGRVKAVVAGLGVCLLGAATGVALVVGLVAGGAVLLHARLEPGKAGFWHKKKRRLLAILAAVTAGPALAYVAPAPELVALAAAALIFHRHLRSGAALAAQAAQDVDQLRAKIVDLEARRRTDAASGPQAQGDNLRKAG